MLTLLGLDTHTSHLTANGSLGNTTPLSLRGAFHCPMLLKEKMFVKFRKHSGNYRYTGLQAPLLTIICDGKDCLWLF